MLLEGSHLLVVEDEMLVLMLIEDMLGDLGCTSIATAATVDHALSLLETKDFDLALLDVNLNGEKSYPIADALAARDVPFIFSTGYADHNTNTAHANRPVLRKPFAVQQLADALGGIVVNARG